MNFDRVLDLLRALEREGVEYILVGGVAMNLQGVTRATQVVDVVIRLTAENVERLKRALRSVWNDPAIDEIQYEELAGEFPAVTYGPPDEVFGIDIVTRFGEAFRYENLEGEDRDWQGVRVRVATAQKLYRMKRNTIRHIDRWDAAELTERFGFKEE